MKWLRRLFYLVVVLVLIGAPVYYWLIVESHIPSEGSYAIDMAQVRALAASLPGDKPAEIRVETVSHLSFPKTIIVAGDTWDAADIPVSSYQLVYADRTAIIDTALTEAQAKASGVPMTSFDIDSYNRISAALHSAALIVITHEHMDHIGGLLAQSDLPKLMPAVRLTKEQVDNPDRMVPATWPPGALDGYTPLDYDRYTAVAPGVVLIKAPGHSPGSQIVYVQRADGAEMLFLGDVAWQHRNIDVQRQRARLMTQFLLKEDRDAVMLQLVELKRLREAEPKLEIMPGHDPDALDHFLSAGLLIKGFK
ncbi:MAG: MBL fold metallo-hydrolase [Alphaproteobacteria bacterium]|nr:MBL fold metallo-hydrolase [Alphaproteobacteria bacterium]